MAIILRDEMQHREIETVNTNLLETLSLSVSWPGGRPTLIGAAYRPPAGSITQAVEQLQEQLRDALTSGKPVYLLGDINVNVLNTESAEVRRYQSALSELNLVQLIQQPTHLMPTPTALDHIICSPSDPAISAEVLNTTVSDHQTIIVNVPAGRSRKRPTERLSRNWRTADWSAICLDLLTADWEPMQAGGDVNDMVANFMENWTATIDRHCPLRTRRVRRPDCPWITDNPDLRDAMRERDQACGVWQEKRTPESRNDYRRRRNEVKRLLSAARRDFLSRQLVESDRREFWTVLKRHFIKPEKSTTAPPSSEAELRTRADKFNSFFATVGSNIAADLREDVAGRLPHPRPPTVVAAAFKPHPVTLAELGRTIRDMNSSGAVGRDGVSLSEIKRCLPVLGPHLLRIVNTSIVSCVFPESWKVATVVPIFKSGDADVPSNFRPISLLSHLSKVLEKVVCDQLSLYLSTNHILYSRQYAYRHCHSTEDAVLDAVDWITKNIDDGAISSITVADLSKAFDSVDHGVLLRKLGWYGVDPSWFLSYLSGRSQVVRGGSETPLPVTHGVPQGSIAGPILFSILTNDLPCHLPNCRVIAYADDTQLLDRARPDDLMALSFRIQASLATLETWFRSNSLKMNPKKTDLMLIGSRQNLKKTRDFQLSVSNTTLIPSGSVRLLGVVLDPVLSWDAHVTQTVKKCNALLISLYRFRHHFTTYILKLLIETHVFPHILYCLSVWGGANKSQLYRIQKLINFAARVVTGTRRRERISPALKTLGWKRVEDLIAERDVVKVHKALYGEHGPSAVRDMFVRRSVVSTRHTRASCAGRLDLTKCRLTLTQKSFRYRAATAWNRLPASVMDCSSLSAFKSALKNS